MSSVLEAADPNKPIAVNVPLTFAAFHNMQGQPSLVRFDHIIGIVAGQATYEDPEYPGTKKTVDCTHIIMAHSPTNVVVSENIAEVCDIWQASLRQVQSRMSGHGGIALPNGAMVG